MKHNLLAAIAILLIFFSACDREIDERFVKPEWLKGDNVMTLEENGNYNHFLALMDKAEYRLAIENQLFTIFAPNDSAFEAYFNDMGIDSVGDLTKKQAEELFGLHILINPRSRDQLIYEYAWEKLESPEGEYGSLFLRKSTYSQYADYNEPVLYDPTYGGDTLLITSPTTYIPLFTTEYFQDYYGDPNGSDYLAMYPESKWSGTQWHDAMVVGEPHGTSSGFIYYVDKVVKPIPTIDKYIRDRPETFGLFYDIAQRFATYGKRGFNEQDVRLYGKSYTGIFDIANALGPNHNGPGEWIYLYTAMIPKNEVLKEYLDNTIFKTYDHIDSVPLPYWQNLLQSHLSQNLEIPSKMALNFRNSFGDRVEFDPNTEIEAGFMCNNGPVYTINRIIEPNLFSCVIGPIVYDRNYTFLLHIFNSAQMLEILSKADKEFTLFAPTNDELLASGIRAVSNEKGEIFIQRKGSDGIFYDLKDIDILQIAQDYYHYGFMEDLSGEGFIRMASGNHVYYNNSKVYSGGNIELDEQNDVIEKFESNKNGNLFYLDKTLRAPQNSAQYLLNNPDFSKFTELLYEAELIDSLQDKYETEVKTPRINFFEEVDIWTVFAPSNQAIEDAEAEGLILHDLDDTKDSLRTFIYYHFVRDKCIFDDGVESGQFRTNYLKIEETISKYQELTINNTKDNLQVTDLSGQTVVVDPKDANGLAQFSVIHKINTCLKPE